MITKLRDMVWGMDIPHPTTPDTREFHEAMQKILKYIDTNLVDNKFALFTDEELHVLKRQAVESSFDIVMSGKYPQELQSTHSQLINGIITEIMKRGCINGRDDKDAR